MKLYKMFKTHSVKRIGKLLNIAIISSFTTFSSYATTINEALRNAYTMDENFFIIQQNFLSHYSDGLDAYTELMPRISGSVQRIYNRQSIGSDVNKNVTNVMSLTAHQDLFNFGGTIQRLKSSKNLTKLYVNEFYMQEQKRVLELIKIYLNFNLAKARLNTIRQEHESSQKLLQFVNTSFRAHQATKMDVSHVQARLSDTKVELLKAQSEFESARLDFHMHFGNIGDNTLWPTVASIITPNDLINFTTKIENNNLDINKAIYQYLSYKSQVLAATTELLPTLRGQADIKKNFGENANDSIGPSMDLRLSLDIPIVQGGHNNSVYNKIRKMRNQMRISRRYIEQVKKNVSINYKTILQYFNDMPQKIKASKDKIQAHKVNFEGMQRKYTEGDITIDKVLNAQSTFFNSRIGLIALEQEHIMLAYQLRSLIGQLSIKHMNLGLENYFDPEFKNRVKNKKSINVKKRKSTTVVKRTRTIHKRPQEN